MKKAINDYFYELRDNWDDANSYGEYALTVYRSRISAAVLAIQGVANVSDLKLNNADVDIALEQTGQVQQVPKLGDIVVNGVVI